MEKFEYLVETFVQDSIVDLQKRLNSKGEEGFEVVDLYRLLEGGKIIVQITYKKNITARRYK